MNRVENERTDCDIQGLGSDCTYIEVRRYYCDRCGNEDVLYISPDGRELCSRCVQTEFGIDLDEYLGGEFTKIVSE